MATQNAQLRQRGLAPKAPRVIPISRSSSVSSFSDSETNTPIPTFTPPTFTIKELLDCIPAHCFERSALRSGSYVLWDILLTIGLVTAATYIDPSFGKAGAVLDGTLGQVAKVAAWALYGYGAGLVWVGIWILAHEAGHGSFSTSKRLNNAVGWVLHSYLLVPYHSWRISHSQHHAATGHMTRDQAFVPATRSSRGLPALDPAATRDEKEGTMPKSTYEKMDDLLEDAPLWALGRLVVHQLFGWPAYLLANASGQSRYPKWYTNHFNPNAIMYDIRHRSQIIMSDVGIGIMLALLTTLGKQTSFLTVVKYYIVPYFWVHHWLVMITFLQHTDPMLPHYGEGAFTFQRGALCTMDRNIHGFFFHGIAETHIAHHLCSKIPHYHAWDATAALKAKLGVHYHQTDENCWVSLWKNYRACRFVEDTGDVVFYKNAKGQAQRRLAGPEDEVSDSGVDFGPVDEGSDK